MSKGGFWKSFAEVFGRQGTKQCPPEESVRLAAAVLLVEVARSDSEHAGLEREELLRLLQAHFDLDPASAQELSAEAEHRADSDISMHAHLDALNGFLSHEQKQAVLRMLWRVAYADARLHRHEEHMLRRFADLLHLSHGDFIRAKLQVTEGT